MNSVLSFVFPQACKICGEFDLSSVQLSFCKECINDVLSEVFCCDICGFFVEIPGSCASCSSGVVLPYRKSGFVTPYKEAARDVILEFKFHGKRRLGKVLGKIMAAEFLGKFGSLDYDVILPVPIHRQRMNERQFNQSELLALELARHISVPVNTSILTQVKPTFEQVDLKIHERWFNIKGVFKASRKAYGKRVLLIDDVYTTGATTWECTNMLLGAGCLFVDVFAFARSQKFYDVPV